MNQKGAIKKLQDRVDFIGRVSGGKYLESRITYYIAKFHKDFGLGKYGPYDPKKRVRLESNYLYWKISREYIKLKRGLKEYEEKS